MIPAEEAPGFNWTAPERRFTRAVMGIGGANVPVVIASATPEEAGKTGTGFDADQTPDFFYVGQHLPQQRVEGRKYIVDFNAYKGEKDTYPIFPYNAMPFIGATKAPLKFLVLRFGTSADEYLHCLKAHPEVVVVSMTGHKNRPGDQRALAHEMMAAGVSNPIVFTQMYGHKASEKGDLQIEAASDMGPLMIDGLTDGLWIMNSGDISLHDLASTSFAILQAARLRTTKTEYISCPGCGRTLYDLRSTIARIKEATKDMRGLKIGIMGCIVNGPGEMADADYGYVGAGRGKVSLYKKKVCVERNIPEEEAVERLLQLIRGDRQAHCIYNKGAQ